MAFGRSTILLGLLPVVAFAWALDAAANSDDLDSIIKFYRKKQELSPTTPIVASELQDSPFGEARQGVLVIGSPPRHSRVGFTASNDGRYVVFGEIEDLTQDPARAVLEQVDLEGLTWKGPDDAPVTIVEYSDFQCPFCSRGYKILEEDVLPAYEGQVRFAYKHLPLSFHDWARAGAIAMECIRRQDPAAAWRVYDGLFEKQKAIKLINVKARALEFAGPEVDEAQYDTCYDNEEPAELIEAQTKEAAGLGITGTPSFVINGRILKGAQPAAKFKAIIDDEIASAK